MFLLLPRQRFQHRQLLGAIAQQLVGDGQPLEVVAHLQLVGHAHAAMQLHRRLRQLPAGARRFQLGRRQHAAAP